VYLDLGELTDDQVEAEQAQPGDDAVDELQPGVMESRVQLVNQALFNGRYERHEQTEQWRRYSVKRLHSGLRSRYDRHTCRMAAPPDLRDGLWVQ